MYYLRSCVPKWKTMQFRGTTPALFIIIIIIIELKHVFN